MSNNYYRFKGYNKRLNYNILGQTFDKQTDRYLAFTHQRSKEETSIEMEQALLRQKQKLPKKTQIVKERVAKSDANGNLTYHNRYRIDRSQVYRNDEHRALSRVLNSELVKPIVATAKKGGGTVFHSSVNYLRQGEDDTGAAFVTQHAEKYTATAVKKLAVAGKNYIADSPYRQLRYYQNALAKSKAAEKMETVSVDGGNSLSKAYQKRRLKRQYTRQYKKEIEETMLHGIHFQKKTLVERVKEWVESKVLKVKRTATLAAVTVIGVIFIAVMGIFTTGTSALIAVSQGVGGSMEEGYYLSDDTDISSVDSLYSELENQLRAELSDTEKKYPGYSGYQYEIPEMNHSSYELASYLATKYGIYSADDIEIEKDLKELLEKQYQVTYQETSDNRLIVSVVNQSISAIAKAEFSEKEFAYFQSCLTAKGQRENLFQDIYSDSGSTTTTPSNQGGNLIETVHKTAKSNTKLTALITEAEKYLGYPYVWGGSTPESSFDCSGFVCYVLRNSGVCSIGRTTAQGLYNSCQPVSSAEAQPGDIIFFTGTYAGPTVTHVGIYCGNNIMIHSASQGVCYVSLETEYYQSHFYAFGRF